MPSLFLFIKNDPEKPEAKGNTGNKVTAKSNKRPFKSDYFPIRSNNTDAAYPLAYRLAGYTVKISKIKNFDKHARNDAKIKNWWGRVCIIYLPKRY